MTYDDNDYDDGGWWIMIMMMGYHDHDGWWWIMVMSDGGWWFACILSFLLQKKCLRIAQLKKKQWVYLYKFEKNKLKKIKKRNLKVHPGFKLPTCWLQA